MEDTIDIRGDALFKLVARWIPQGTVPVAEATYHSESNDGLLSAPSNADASS